MILERKQKGLSREESIKFVQKYSRDNARTPMQWNKGVNLGFSSAPSEMLYLPVDKSPDAVTVEEQLKEPDSILNTLKKVIAIRHKNADLQSDGDFEVVYVTSVYWTSTAKDLSSSYCSWFSSNEISFGINRAKMSIRCVKN